MIELGRSDNASLLRAAAAPYNGPTPYAFSEWLIARQTVVERWRKSPLPGLVFGSRISRQVLGDFSERFMEEKRKGLYKFAPFRLDAEERLLLHQGELVPLPPKAFDVLLALVEQPGHLLEKEVLLKRVWPDTFVEENNLADNISRLRKALGDGEDGRKFIETIPRRGYRFVAEVVEIKEKNEAEAVPSLAPLGAAATTLAERNAMQWHRRPQIFLIACGLLVLVWLGWREFSRAKRTWDSAPHPVQLTRFTASGNVVSAAISADGKYVATVLNEHGLQSLWMRQTAVNTSGVQLLAPALLEFWGLTFSPDGNFIYYVSWVRNQLNAELFQLPVLGGAPRKVAAIDNIDTPISFAPAGDRFTYVGSSSSRGESWLKIGFVNGGTETLITRRQGFLASWPGGPAWSPDGQAIAYAGSDSNADNAKRVQVFIADVWGKTERRLTVQGWQEIGRVAWLGDGSGLLISAREQLDGQHQLWLVAYPSGAARKLTNDLHDYGSVSVTADGKTLAAVQFQTTFSISVTPYSSKGQVSDDPAQTSEVFTESGNAREGLTWTPDHRLIYASRASGNWDIWLMNRDGSGKKQLTADPHNDLFPAMAADGRYVYFASDRAGAFNIWRQEIDGITEGGVKQLTRGAYQTLPEVTHNGQWVIFNQGLGLPEPSVWRVASAGGEAQLLIDGSQPDLRLPQRPVVSPDGRWLAHVYADDQGWGVAVRAWEGGALKRKFAFPPNVGARVFRWTPDGQALAYIVNEKGISNIWLQPLNGAPPTQLTHFQTGQLISFAWSPDGQWLAYLRTTATSDVVLLKDFF